MTMFMIILKGLAEAVTIMSLLIVLAFIWLAYLEPETLSTIVDYLTNHGPFSQDLDGARNHFNQLPY